MLGAERLRSERGIGDGCGGRRRLQGGEGAKDARALSRLLLRPRERSPQRQESKHKDDNYAHDFLPAAYTAAHSARGSFIDYLLRQWASWNKAAAIRVALASRLAGHSVWAFPHLDRAPVEERYCCLNRDLIVNALHFLGRIGNVAVINQKIDAIVRHQQPPATCALVRLRTKLCTIVVCSRSALEVKQNKNMLMA